MMKTLFLLNHPSHYRKSIFQLLESRIKCDFAFGHLIKGNIKSLDKSEFQKPFRNLKTLYFVLGLYYIVGSVRLSLLGNYQRIVLTGEFKSLSTWAILILNLVNPRKIKVYLWTHGYYGSEKFFKRIIKKIYFKLCDGVFLYGDYAKKLMLEKKIIEEKKIHVIYNSLDFELHNNYYETLSCSKKQNPFFKHFKNNYPNLIFIGRLTEVKKIDLLFKALKLAVKSNQPFNVFIIGEGIQYDFLVNYVNKNNLNKYVVFHGQEYNEKIISTYLFYADTCVSPGNVGLTAIHSLTYSTPVITHDFFQKQMPEFESIRNGCNGYFFKYDDENDLYQKIIKCFKLSKILDKDEIRQPILQYYNPKYQIKVFENVLK